LTGFWKPALSAGGVLMPKTSMHKNNLLKAGKYNVRATRKVFAMQTKPEAHAMNH
jgi:hypothetical protein